MVTVPKVFKMECHLAVKLGIVPCEIWGSLSDVTDDSSHLLCNTLSFGKYFPLFWRTADPPHIEEPLTRWHHRRGLELSSFFPVILCLACRYNDRYYIGRKKCVEWTSWRQGGCQGTRVFVCIPDYEIFLTLFFSFCGATDQVRPKRLRCSGGVACCLLSTQVRGFKPGWSSQDFSGWKSSSARLPSEGK